MDLVLQTRLISRVPPKQALHHPLLLASSLSLCNPHSSRLQAARLEIKRPNELSQCRRIHTRRKVSSSAYAAAETDSHTSEMPPSRPLSCVPLLSLIRSYAVTSVSSVPFLLQPSLVAMGFLAHTKSRLFNPDHNPILHFFLKRTFYAQFCAGETPAEVRATVLGLKNTGFKGVILGHAKEAVLSQEEMKGLDRSMDAAAQARINAQEISIWKQNTIDTVDLAQEGDFVALKFTGAGHQALRHLKATIACSTEFEEAVHEMCRRAQQKGVKLLFDAEQASLQQGIDNWTMYFAKIYNKEKALVYGTYQAYAKRTPRTLATHLELARKEGFVLGVKLVRGAYMGSDPRDLIWPTVEETHGCYDGIARSVMKRQYEGILQPIEGNPSEFPSVSLVLATHNAQSVKLAEELRDEQARNGVPRIELAYGQLMGMADNVSYEVVQTARARLQSHEPNVEVPRAYKYLVWGKMGDCMKYLLRRAHENRDAVSRTVEARRALGQELGSRIAFWR